MDTFTTILIWLGSGFAFAGGIFLAVILMALIGPNKDNRKKQDDVNAETIRLLKERNEIDARSHAVLSDISVDIAIIAKAYAEMYDDEPEDEPA